MEKMDRLRAQVIQNETNIQELKLSCEYIKKLIENCQNQILEAGGTRFKAQRSKVNDLKEQIKLQEKRKTKLLIQKSSHEKQISTVNLREGNENLKTEIETEIELNEIKIKNLTIEAFKLKGEEGNLLKTFEDLNENIELLKKENEIILKEMTKFRKKEIEFKNQIENLLKEIEELKKKILNFENLLKKLEINSEVFDYNDDDDDDDDDDNDDDDKIPELSYHQLSSRTNTNALEQIIKSLESELTEMRPNLKVIQEYREKEKIYKNQKEELKEIERKRDENRFNYENLRKLRYDQFMSAFRQISLKLKELYQLITMGGNAELELVDSLDPFTEGILFSVMPPKKSWKNISNLSGGEKTLSSLALVFALHSFKPTPIYVMDEIDAALDFRNVSIVANYLKDRTKDAQFIVISLRNDMFELADSLVGIYKTNQRTKSVTIDPKSFYIKTQ